jgi:hypothetical protein
VTDKSQRKTPRIAFKASINILIEGKIIGPCNAKDLSLGGIFVIVNPQKFAVGKCIIQIVRQATISKTLEIPANVVRVTKKGVGVQFTEMDCDAFNILSEIIVNADGA